MSLTEYWQQSERLSPGQVVLKPEEFELGYTIQTPGRRDCDTLTQVFIPVFGKSTEYVVKDGKGVLYTTDEHGSPKNPSVFAI